ERLELLVDTAQKEGLKKSLEISAADYARAWQKKMEITRAILAQFEKFDALVSPSLVIEAITLDTNLQTAFRRRGGMTVLGALCGVPQLTVPMGFGANKMPLGFSFTSNLFAENTILQMGMLFQRETDWHRRKPQIVEPSLRGGL
ncbi:MAG: hypothetical protein HY070_12660, partial [Chloroflexi bacterium]|nr:hypothetical protein [Chloroflexota bacterium]